MSFKAEGLQRQRSKTGSKGKENTSHWSRNSGVNIVEKKNSHHLRRPKALWYLLRRSRFYLATERKRILCCCCCSGPKSCPALRDHMDCSMPGLPVSHHLLEFAQVPVHWISDAIQPSHPLLLSSPFAFNISQHQCLFQRVSSSDKVVKVLEEENLKKEKKGNLKTKKTAWGHRKNCMSWFGAALILPDVPFYSKEYSHPNSKLCNLPRYMGHGDDRVP